ncbi:PH domain-containing protein [Saccharospirillum impatiens]|uniref:PH domain-containing protein n=1 Tax=Saccharospirillum impatiens TaxID=169438 RepID=UPI0004113DC5|nr:PH domain-containing protein [Saccharospirillum impatiens]
MFAPSISLAVDEYIISRGYRHTLVWAVLAVIAIAGLFNSWFVLVVACCFAIDQSGYELQITTRKVVDQRGTFFRRTTHIPLHTLESMDITCYGLPFLFETGTLTLRTNAGSVHRFHCINHPEATVRLLDALCRGHELVSQSPVVHRVRRHRDALKGVVS